MTSLEEHYLTEKHQNTLVILGQQLTSKKLNEKKTEQITANLERCDESLSASTERLETITDEILHLDSNTLLVDHRLGSVFENIQIAEQIILSEKGQIEAISINQQILTQECAGLKQQMECSIAKRNHHVLDGMMIWKISNVREKIYDAQSERQPSIYSPPFYTSTAGYKLCVRLYFNGDGAARGTHLSIFLVILRGEYDALVHWPFSYQVTFCLFDQRTMIQSVGVKQCQHVIGSFRPDITSISFKRPCSAMNIASGIPQYLPVESLDDSHETNRYIVNDTMFIKVFVDFLGVQKSMLPFIFDLNIALPVHIQRKLVDKENKRRNESNNA